MSTNSERDAALCGFSIAWRGPCNDPVVIRGACERHAWKVCGIKGCEQQAVAECNQTMSFVCGFLLCTEHRNAEHWGHLGC